MSGGVEGKNSSPKHTQQTMNLVTVSQSKGKAWNHQSTGGMAGTPGEPRLSGALVNLTKPVALKTWLNLFVLSQARNPLSPTLGPRSICILAGDVVHVCASRSPIVGHAECSRSEAYCAHTGEARKTSGPRICSGQVSAPCECAPKKRVLKSFVDLKLRVRDCGPNSVKT